MSMDDLRGIVIDDTPDTLVIQASPEQIQRFTRQQDVRVQHVLPQGYHTATMSNMDGSQAVLLSAQPGTPVYTYDRVLVGYITSMDLTTDAVEITTAGDTTRRFLPGRPRYRTVVER